MNMVSSRHVYFGSWVEGVARHINDPVQRLRFVRVAAPCGDPAPPPTLMKRMRAMLFPAAITALILFFLGVAALCFHFAHG